MFEELSKYINKSVALLLKNGKEKKGRIVFLDSDDQTITFEDESTLAISFVKSIGGTDSVQTTPQPQLVQEKPADLPTPIEEPAPVPVVLIPETPPEIIEKANQIKQQHEDSIAEAQLLLKAPELSGMPAEIKDIDGIGKSDEAKLWTNILNQYNDGVRLGKFATDVDKVEKILVHINSLASSPYLQNFIAIPQLLGYLTFMQGQKKEALEYIKQVIKVEDSPEHWITLGAVALEAGEHELAFFTLKKLFFKVNFTENAYKNIWHKFLELIISMKAYNDFFMIFSSKYRQFSEAERTGIFEAVVYFLLKNRQRKDAQDLLLASQKTGADHKQIALDMLKKLGQPDREYEPEPVIIQEVATPTETLPKKEIINLPPPTPRKAKVSLSEVASIVSEYTFSSNIINLKDNYGFIKYGTNNLFFYGNDLVNCTFAELSEGDAVEFKLKKGVKGSDVAGEVRLIGEPKRNLDGTLKSLRK